MTTHTAKGGGVPADQDLLAIRALMAQDAPTEAPRHVVRGSAEPTAEPGPAPDTDTAQPQVRRTLFIRPRHVAVVALTLFAVFRPVIMLQAILLLLSPIIVLLIFVSIVGVAGFWRRSRSLHQRIKARNPKLAERLRKGFYDGADTWDAMMDRMPTRMPEAAYAPDFHAEAAAEAAHERALEKRFARLRDEMSA